MKLWERAIERRLRRDISIWENPFGFMPYRSTAKAIYITRKLMELHRDRKKDLCMVFIGLEKAHDRVLCEVLSECLGKKEVLVTYF